MAEPVDVRAYPVRELLSALLRDKTTGRNIIWATDAYETFGPGFSDKSPIDSELILTSPDFVLRPRAGKSGEEQLARTRKKAEVMTPVWLCNKMNNYADEQWFGQKNVFNAENKDHTWTVNEAPVPFENTRAWQRYVDSRRLEITCGEAPYLVSRYDTTTGEEIVPLSGRIGILDRKLRVVNENTAEEAEWTEWALRAVESCYGYEYQGDNLLIARINVLLTFYEFFRERWNKEPGLRLLRQVTNVICWNLWQMDGLKDTVPLGRPYVPYRQMSLMDLLMADEPAVEAEPEATPCVIYDWRSKTQLRYMDCKKRGESI